MTVDPPSASSSELAAGLSALCSMLWQERISLETILFKLVEEQLIVSLGHARFLQLADDELRDAARILRENEVLRAAETEMVTRLVGLPSDVSLIRLAARVDEPWSGMLLEHREAVRALLVEIEAAASANRTVLLAGAEAARAALEEMDSAVAADDPWAGGAVTRGPASPLDGSA